MICWFKAWWPVINAKRSLRLGKRTKKKPRLRICRARLRKTQNAPIAAKITSLMTSSAAAKSQLIIIPSQWFWWELKVDQVEPGEKKQRTICATLFRNSDHEDNEKNQFRLTKSSVFVSTILCFDWKHRPATKQPWYRTIYSHVLQLFTTNQPMQHKKLRLSSRRINFR